MFSKTVRRSLLMIFVMTLLVLPGVAQAGALDPVGERTIPSLGRFQEQVQSWAEGLWGSFSELWEKGGPGLDPHGGESGGTGSGGGSTPPPTGGTTTGGDGGVSIDPNGNP